MAYPKETKQKIAWLRKHGFTVGARDTRLNTAFIGTWMVAENYELGHTQVDGSGGVWCIVGTSLAQIVDDAYEAHHVESPRVWVIKHQSMNLWWSSYGWQNSKAEASRYTAEQRATMSLPHASVWYKLTVNEL